jgi:hypothetical protein
MTNYAGAEEALIDKWVLETLQAHTPFDTLSAGLTGRIYDRLAAAGTRFPYIIFQAQTPPVVSRGIGDVTVLVSTIYIVKAVAQTSTYDTLAPVAAAIKDAMSAPNGATADGGLIFATSYEGGFSLVESESSTQYRHLGGQYRIQAQAS